MTRVNALILATAALAVVCAIAWGPSIADDPAAEWIVPPAIDAWRANVLGLGIVAAVAGAVFVGMLGLTCLYRNFPGYAEGRHAQPARIEALWGAVPVLIFVGMAALAARDLGNF